MNGWGELLSRFVCFKEGDRGCGSGFFYRDIRSKDLRAHATIMFLGFQLTAKQFGGGVK